MKAKTLSKPLTVDDNSTLNLLRNKLVYTDSIKLNDIDKTIPHITRKECAKNAIKFYKEHYAK